MASLSAFFCLATLAVAQIQNTLQYVDPLIGTANGGDVFPGATLPYGMAKAVADTDSQDNQGGFTSEGGNVTGFSSMHDSGTGGEPSLGLWALFPYASCPDDDINRCKFVKASRKTHYRNDSVKATPGFFGITLDNGIAAEMSAAAHTTLFKFSFSGAQGTGSPVVVLDLTDLHDSRQDNATVLVESDTGRMTGYGRFQPSFGQGYYTAYYCADFHGSEIRDNGVYVNTRANTDVKELQISRGINGFPLPGGAFNRFKSGSDVYVRLGLSFVSSDQACKAAEQEMPDFDLKTVRATAESAWAEKLKPISVSTTGVDKSVLTNFYSGIYRTMVNPQNYTGFVPVVGQDEIWFDSFYCLWDSFRSQIPFLTVLDPDSVGDMIKGLLNIYRVRGWLPDCTMSLSKGYTQGGSNADVVLVDGYLKLDRDDIDWKTAYKAVVKDAEEEPYDWCCNGRGGLDSWKSLHYIPAQDFDYKGFGTMTRSISRNLEYSYNDFCISLMAAKLGQQGDAEKYQGTSGNWFNLFKRDQTSKINGTDTGFVGFFQPKYLNQTWGFQDPLYCSNIDTSPNQVCSLQATAGETFESSIWEYSFFVPHDQAKLITAFGGPSTFVKRLDYLHDQKITYIGNEPAFLTVFQYHYAGRPALSAKRSHFYIPEFFKTSVDGLPGNDDSGAMGSFVAFSMMGLFPNPGQDVYLITPPFFESVNITSPTTGKTATVRNVGFDAAYQNIYIQKATLDGKAYTKNWIDHSFFTEGKELVLYLGANESSWGTRVEDLPPSLSRYDFGG